MSVGIISAAPIVGAEYEVEGDKFGTRLHQARARARHLANQYGRPVEVTLGGRVVCTYNRGGELTNVTPQDPPPATARG